MIKSFKHKGLERFFKTGSQAGIHAIHGARLRLVLALLNDAVEIDDIDAPALRLHPLKGDLAGFWAVTVQANWPAFPDLKLSPARDDHFQIAALVQLQGFHHCRRPAHRHTVSSLPYLHGCLGGYTSKIVYPPSVKLPSLTPAA